MDTDLLRLLSMLTQGGRGQAGPVQPMTQLPPDYAARQLLGGGVLGQGLSAQRSALDDPVAALTAQAGARPAQAELAQQVQGMPAAGGSFYRPDDPSTFNPAQLAEYMKAHGIKKRSAMDELMAFLSNAAQPATAAASSGAKSLSSIFGAGAKP